MRNILIAVGSGISGANTDRLAEAFARGAVDAGHTVRKIFLGKGELKGCRGCGACQKGGRCAIRDIMQEAYPLFDACDTLVLASPLYFWTLSGQIKTFFDRLYAFSREDIYPHRDTVLLMTAGDDGEHTFDHALDYYRHLPAGPGRWRRQCRHLRRELCLPHRASHRPVPGQGPLFPYPLNSLLLFRRPYPCVPGGSGVHRSPVPEKLLLL